MADDRLGIHLGSEIVSAVLLDTGGAVRKQVAWPPPVGQERWYYSESDVQALCMSLGEHFDHERCTVALSVPIDAVFFRRIEVPVSEEAGEDAVRYAAEPLLPMPLDELHLAVRRHGAEAEVLAMPREPWERVFHALDEDGWVCPRAVCDADAFVQAVASQEHSDGPAEVVAIVAAKRGVVGVWYGGSLRMLRPLPALHDDFAVDRELERTGCAACGDKPFVIRRWGQGAIPLAELLPEVLLDAAGTLFAWQAAGALGEPVVMNLRGGSLRSVPLQRRTGRWLLAHGVAATLVILLLAGALLLRGAWLQDRAVAYQAEGRRIWLTLFPDRMPPADIVSMLVSEQARERGLREAAGGTGGVPVYEPALDVLQRVVGGLPEAVRLRVQQIELTGGASVITGQALGHGMVEQIALGIQQTSGLAVEPPQTRRTEIGPVQFTLRFNRKRHDG